jgi:osmotically-inducible protein OsmY
MDDLTLRQSILDELEFEPSIDAANIGVAVDDGIVTLTGHVGSYVEKLTAERVVQGVKGVRAVAQELEVRFPGDRKSADDEIAKRALDLIAWDTTVPKDQVRIKVQGGWITLSGEVEWYFQKQAAEHAVRKLSGVVGVLNELTIRPRVVDESDVKSRIEDALERNAEIEADGIHVGVAGSSVTLEGAVHSWHERAVAQRAAWSIPGVSFVDNRLAIS